MIIKILLKNKLVILVLCLNLIAISAWVTLFFFLIKTNTNKTSPSLSYNGSQREIELIKASLRSNSSKIEILRSQFVSRDSTIKLIEQIESSARQSDVKLTMNQAEYGKEASIAFSTEGNFDNVLQFLALIDNSSFRLSFNRISLVKAEKKWRAEFSSNLLDLEKAGTL